MVIADPSAELVELARRAPLDAGGSPPTAADAARAALVRRRFGLALPAPFTDGPDGSPVRPAVAADGPAIAAVKWRASAVAYRGVLPDAFLDQAELVPPVGFWVGRALRPPSRRHALVVWGRPGSVLGYADAGPGRDDGVDPERTGEVYELYVDPQAQRRGGGRALADAAVERLRAAGFDEVVLWAFAANQPALAFYEAVGWRRDGGARTEDLGVACVEEVRFRRP